VCVSAWAVATELQQMLDASHRIHAKSGTVTLGNLSWYGGELTYTDAGWATAGAQSYGLHTAALGFTAGQPHHQAGSVRAPPRCLRSRRCRRPTTGD
jgi:hypothetical protein